MPLLEAIGQGVSVRDACALAGISRQTFYEQSRRDPVLADAVAYLRGRKSEPDPALPVPDWWLLARRIPLLRAPRNRTEVREPPDRQRREHEARWLQARGLTLRQIGQQLADAEGLDSPLTVRQVRYAVHQPADETTGAARVAYAAFERANRDTAEASRMLYRELRALKLPPETAAARVRAIVALEDTATDLPRKARDAAFTVAERAKYRDAARLTWRNGLVA